MSAGARQWQVSVWAREAVWVGAARGGGCGEGESGHVYIKCRAKTLFQPAERNCRIVIRMPVLRRAYTVASANT